tara:strand:- start:88 stop:267 length:180 start_codon:yes stop_codon:yes gene_type:complete
VCAVSNLRSKSQLSQQVHCSLVAEEKRYETPKSAYQNKRGGLGDSVEWSGEEKQTLGED